MPGVVGSIAVDVDDPPAQPGTPAGLGQHGFKPPCQATIGGMVVAPPEETLRGQLEYRACCSRDEGSSGPGVGATQVRLQWS